MIFSTTILLHTLVFLTGTLLIIQISKAKIPIFEKDRISPNVLWPWEEENPSIWTHMKSRSLKILLHHHFLLTPAALLLDYHLSGTYFRTDIESLPGLKEILLQIVLFMICDDFFFYWGHRLLHYSWFYTYIHKLHHEFYNPVVFSGEFDHPVEFFVGSVSQNLMPRLLGRRCHFMTNIMWLIVRTFVVLDDHLGYEFSWGPFGLVPFSGNLFAFSLIFILIGFRLS